MLLKKFNETKQVPITGGIPNKEEIMKRIIEDSKKPEFQLKNNDNDMKIGISYAPTVLTVMNQGKEIPDVIKVDSRIRNILLQEQIDIISNVKQAYDNTNCNIDILAKAHNLSIQSMVDMIVENHINELKFMICQLDDNICNILNHYFPDKGDLNIDTVINLIYTYRSNVISNIMKVVDFPEDTRTASYEEGLQLYLISNMNYIAQDIWNNIERCILYIINDSANYKINPNKIFEDAGFEFSAFMMGCYASLGKLFYNLANPIGIGTFNGAPPVEDDKSNNLNEPISISFF